MSAVVAPSENVCDTTRVAGTDACGGGVGPGSYVRLGVATGDSVGADVDVGIALVTTGGVGDAPSDGVTAGAAHETSTATANAAADHRACDRTRPITDASVTPRPGTG